MQLTVKQNPDPYIRVECSCDCHYYNVFEAGCNFPGENKDPNDERCRPFAKWFASVINHAPFEEDYP